MTAQTKEQITKLLIVEGYEKDLNDIFFIEDMEFLEDELIEFNVEPIEIEEFH